MSHITIRNFGPIKDIALPIKKYNIFIGNSGTGKSTLAKVICNAQWLEKELVVSNEERPKDISTATTYINQLIEYHNLNGYLQPDTYIEYQGAYLTFKFDNAKGETAFSYTLRRDLDSFCRLKTLYVPSERSMVAAIPNWFEIKLPNTNLRSFLSAWQNARLTFSIGNPLPLIPFDAKYYSTKEEPSDFIEFVDGKKLLLPYVASGLQATVPLTALTSYFSRPTLFRMHYSLLDQQYLSDVIQYVKSYKGNDEIGKVESFEVKEDGSLEIEGKHIDDLKHRFENLTKVKGTSFFIEEPELNLFPKLQNELFKDIIKSINSIKDNALTITTHSPYILAFLSNYIYAHHLQYAKGIDVTDLIPTVLMMDGDKVSAYLLENGTATNILSSDPSLGIDIKELDSVSEEIGDIWDQLVDRELER